MAIIFNPDRPFSKIRHVISESTKVNRDNVCIQPEVDKEMDGKYNKLNGRFFELELDKPLDRQLALFFGLVPYKVGVDGKKSIL